MSAVNEEAVPAGVYVMRSASQQCCEMTDSRGTHFNVISNGHMYAEKTEEPAGNQETHTPEDKDSKATADQDSESANTDREEQTPTSVTQAPLTSLVPRFFIVHADGSGTELLRPCDVQDFLAQAEKDPGIAVLRSPVEGQPDVSGITILRPYSGESNTTH